MGASPGTGDVLVWCGHPDVFAVGRRVVLEAPGEEQGTWVVTELNSKGERTHETITVGIKDLIPQDMAE